MKKMLNKKGFTLIEIIVVIVILAVLMAVAVPSVMSYLNEGEKAKFESTGRAVYIAVQREFADAYANNDTKPTASDETVMSNAKTRLAKDDVNATVTEFAVNSTGTNVTSVKATIVIDGDQADVTVVGNKKTTVGTIGKVKTN